MLGTTFAFLLFNFFRNAPIFISPLSSHGLVGQLVRSALYCAVNLQSLRAGALSAIREWTPSENSAALPLKFAAIDLEPAITRFAEMAANRFWPGFRVENGKGTRTRAPAPDTGRRRQVRPSCGDLHLRFSSIFFWVPWRPFFVLRRALWRSPVTYFLRGRPYHLFRTLAFHAFDVSSRF
jgi:hypothetical protein